MFRSLYLCLILLIAPFSQNAAASSLISNFESTNGIDGLEYIDLAHDDKNTVVFVGRGVRQGTTQLYKRSDDDSIPVHLTLGLDNEVANANIDNVALAKDASRVYFTSDATNLTASSVSKLYYYSFADATIYSVDLTYNDNSDPGVQELFVIGNSHDLYFTSNSINIIEDNTVVTPEKRLYRYNASTGERILIKDGLDNARLVATSGDSSNLLFLSSRLLTNGDCQYGEKLFLYQVSTDSFTFVPGTKPVDGGHCESVDNAVISFDGNHIYLDQDVNSWSGSDTISYYNVAEGQVREIVLPTLRNELIADVSSDGRYLLLFAQPVWLHSTSSFYLYYYDTHASALTLVGLNSAHNLIRLSPVMRRQSQMGNSAQKFVFGTDSWFGSVYLNDLNQFNYAEPLAISNIQSSTEVGVINLSWDAGSNVARHVVYRRESGQSDYQYVGTNSANTLSYTDSSLTDATVSYDYRIEACNVVDRCIATEVTGLSVLAPAKVTGLGLRDVSIDQTELSWVALDDSRLRYQVLVRHNFNDQLSGSIYGNTWNLSFRQQGDSIVRVRACLNSLCGEYSDPITLAARPTLYATNFKFFVNDNYSAVEVNWDPVASAAHYRVYVRHSGGDRQFRQKVFSPRFTDRVLPNEDKNIEYLVESCIEDDTCSNMAGDTFNYKTDFSRLLERPFIDIRVQANYINLSSWSSRLSSFETINIYRRTERFGQPTLIHSIEHGFSDHRFSYDDYATVPEQDYFYLVEGCVNQSCVRSRDYFVTGSSAFGNKLANIVDLAASSNTYQGHIHLTWSLNGEADGIIVYRDNSQVAVLEDGETEYRDFTATENQEFEYYLVPYFKIGTSEQHGKRSNIAVGIISTDQGSQYIPATPTGLEASQARYFDRINLSWAPSEHATVYRLLQSETIDGEYQVVVNATSRTSYAFRLQRPGASAYFKVQACTRIGCSDASAAALGTTSDVISAPTQPSTITNVGLNENGNIVVDYSVASDAVYYEVLRKRDIYSTSEEVYTSEHSPFLQEHYSSGATYYYRVRTCNPAGCGAPSDYFEYTAPGNSSGSNRPAFYSVRILTESETNIAVSIRRDRHGSGGFNLYVSESETGDKTLLMSEANANYSGYGYDFTEATQGTNYYFWLENCYLGNCELNREFLVGALLVPEPVPPIPSGLNLETRGAEAFATVDFLPYGARIEIIATTQGENARDFETSIAASGGSNSVKLWIDRGVYNPIQYNVQSRQCLADSCSAYTDATTISLLPQYTTRVEDIRFWTGTPVFYQGKDAYRPYNSGYQTVSALHIGGGFSFNASLYLRLINTSTQCQRQVNLVASTGISANNAPKLPILSIYNGGEACENPSMAAQDKFYLVLDGDTSNALELGEEAGSGWIPLSFTVDSGSVMAGTLGDTAFAASLTGLNRVGIDFVDFEFSGSNSTYSFVADMAISSQTEFDKDRPEPVSIRSLQDRGAEMIAYLENPSSAAVYSHRELVMLSADASTRLRSQVITNDSSHTFTIDENGSYWVFYRICSNICSPYSSASEDMGSQSSLSRPSVNLVSSDTLEQLSASWNQISGATFYKIYGLQAQHNYPTPWEEYFITETTQNSYNLEGITGKYHVWVKACNQELCSSFSWARSATPTMDQDGDGLTDEEEFELGTDPLVPDTDGDGVSDGDEVAQGTDPLQGSTDSDGDGINDSVDLYPNDPQRWTNVDSDGDSITDDTEQLLGLNSADAADVWSDLDGDRMPLYIELLEGRNQSSRDNDIFTNNRLLVQQAYLDMKGRFASLSELDAALAQLAQGQMTPLDLYSSLLQEDSLQILSFVGRAYEAMLNRAPDPGGFLLYRRLFVAAQMTEEQLVDIFINSAEFRVRYGNLSNADFVRLVYQNVLKRDADDGGLAAWVNALNAGVISRNGMMLDFIRSQEFINSSDVKHRLNGVGLVLTGYSRLGAENVVGHVAWDGSRANIRSVIRELLASDQNRQMLMTGVSLSMADTDGDSAPDGLEFSDGTQSDVKDNDVNNNNRLFVRQTLRDLYGYGYPISEEDNQLNSLVSLGNRGDWVKGLLQDTRIASKRKAITRFYKAILGRRADHAGLMAWIAQHEASGLPLQSIADTFVYSAEFQNRYGSLSNSDFVSLVYQNVLGRPADAAGYTHWLTQLNLGNIRRGDMMLGFSESLEHRNRTFNGDSIEILYHLLLRRAPVQAEFDSWHTALSTGTDISSLATTILASSEYQARFY